MHDSAFYYDLPTLGEEREMRWKIQHRYDDLLPEGWKAPYQSRRDIVTWTCEHRNSYMQQRNAPEGLIEDCKNYNQLLKKYGPDYGPLRAKLGHVRGLFED